MRVRLTCVIAVFCFILLLPLSAKASLFDNDGAGEFTVHLAYDGLDIADMNFKLYKIATMKENYSYEIDSHFNSFTVSDFLAADDGNKHSELAAKLVEKIGGLSPVASGQTDASGSFTFSGLDFGIYLLVPVEKPTDTHYFLPLLIQLPYYDETEADWIYRRTGPLSIRPKVEIKDTSTPPGDNDPIIPPPPPATPGTPEQPDPPRVGFTLPRSRYFSIGMPPVPPERLIPAGPGVFIEIDKDGKQIGIWRYDYVLGLWVFEVLQGLDLTQTGVLRWPIPVLAVTGILMFGAGIYVYRKGVSLS
jgi:hypothetical protein